MEPAKEGRWWALTDAALYIRPKTKCFSSEDVYGWRIPHEDIADVICTPSSGPGGIELLIRFVQDGELRELRGTFRIRTFTLAGDLRQVLGER